MHEEGGYSIYVGVGGGGSLGPSVRVRCMSRCLIGRIVELANRGDHKRAPRRYCNCGLASS